MEEPSRIEKLVGEVLGLRMIVAQLLKQQSHAGNAIAETQGAALAAIETWPIGSDTPEGAERIRGCARTMLKAFPAPTA